MESVLIIITYTLIVVVSLACAGVLWSKRKEVSDLSRTFLSSFSFIVGVLAATRLIKFAVDPSYSPFHELISPFLVIGGLCAITLFLIYPIEVIRPQLLRRWRFVLPFVPVILLSIPSLVGMKYQMLQSTDDLMEHLLEFNVLLRLLGVAIVFLISMSLMAIPYNWRETSVNYHWILRTTLIAQVISVLFFVQSFTSSAIAQLIHLLWVCISLFYFTYFELRERLQPVELPNDVGGRSKSTVPKGDLWQQISYLMDIKEYWRNPDTSVETISKSLGTNRIYVARSVKEHTGMSFNDYMNSRRVEYMATMLRQNPEINQKTLFFAAGFRSYPTAHRNFTKFKGCSPTDYITKS